MLNNEYVKIKVEKGYSSNNKGMINSALVEKSQNE